MGFVSVVCPGCGKRLKAPAERAGKNVKCNGCGAKFRVPTAQPAALSLDDDPADAASDFSFDAPLPPRPKAGLFGPLMVVGLLLAVGAAVVAGLYFTRQRVRVAEQMAMEAARVEADARAAVEAEAKLPPAPGPANVGQPRVASPGLPLPANRTFTFRPLAAKPELIQRPTFTLPIDLPFASVRRVFPPANQNIDTVVVWQSREPFQGAGERLAADWFSTGTGRRIGRVEFDGDNRPEVVCDVSADGELFAAASSGKVTVWKLADQTKLLDAFDPYADKPDHKKAGLAAVYLTVMPLRLVTVTAGGAVHVWNPETKQLVHGFEPRFLNTGMIRPVGTAIDPGRSVVTVAFGRTIYHVWVSPDGKPMGQTEVPYQVNRVIGVATTGTPGKVLYVFEGANQEIGVAAATPEGKQAVWKWPAGVGDPVGAGWASNQVAVVGTSTGGAVWFDFEEGILLPLAQVIVPGGKARHFPVEASHWYLLPADASGAKCVLAELGMPPDGFIDYREAAEKKLPAYTLRLDATGLHR